jgi:GAF domain-containing protein
VIDQRTLHVWEWLAEYAGTRAAPLSLRTVCAAGVWRTGMTGAWVARGDPLAEPAFVTDRAAATLADLACVLGEGPAADATRGGRPVAVTDLSAAPNRRAWPVYTAAALEAGARAVLAVPLRSGTVKIGLLGLYSRRPRVLVTPQRAEVAVVAEVVLGLLLGEGRPGHAPPAHRDAPPWPEIHQAAGIVAVQLGVGVAESLACLRAHAYAQARPLLEIAHEVVARRLRFSPNTPEGGIGGS